ncbi:unnamed protein product [Hapterophycus canaliculatus]
MTGRLFNMAGAASAHVRVDGNGAIAHTRSTGKAQVTAQGRRTKPAPTETTILVGADPRKMARVVENRAALREMKQEEMKRAASGDDGPKEGNAATSVMAWMPYGKRGFLRKRELERAKDKLGQTEMRVTSRGKVEASVDGTTVSRVSGPSWFGHLRRDNSHELKVTDDGLEVTRGGEYVWGIRISEL